MNREILLITERLKDAYEGDPWYGRNIRDILSEIDEDLAFQKPSGQHSILELVWHMINWREFVISRFRNDLQLSHFEKNDWRALDHNDRSLWKKGLDRLQELQGELVILFQQQQDSILLEKIHERDYDFRKLLSGIVEHDIYHLGQIAYIKKLLQH